MSPQFWLGLQMDYDLDVAEDALGARLDREIAVRQAIHGEAA
jgi:plasmid maintenance system antidote protein VapI